MSRTLSRDSRRLAPGLAVALCFVLVACSKDVPGSSPGTDGSAPVEAVPDAAIPSPIAFDAAREFVAADRLAGAVDADACGRLESSAGRVRRALEQLPRVAGVAVAVKTATASFGAFDGLLFGEVARSASAAGADGSVSRPELDLLEIELGHHLGSGGVPVAERTAIVAALSEAARGPVEGPAQRARAVDAIVRLSELFADVQACSPKP